MHQTGNLWSSEVHVRESMPRKPTQDMLLSGIAYVAEYDHVRCEGAFTYVYQPRLTTPSKCPLPCVDIDHSVAQADPWNRGQLRHPVTYCVLLVIVAYCAKTTGQRLTCRVEWQACTYSTLGRLPASIPVRSRCLVLVRASACNAAHDDRNLTACAYLDIVYTSAHHSIADRIL